MPRRGPHWDELTKVVLCKINNANGDLFMQISVNGDPMEVAPGTSIEQLLERLKLKSKYVAVECNLQLVPRAQHAECELQTDDCLEIVTLVGGG